MALKNLTTDQLRDERRMIDSALAGAEFRIHTRRDLDDIEEMHLRHEIRRYRDYLNAINNEMETRK